MNHTRTLPWLASIIISLSAFTTRLEAAAPISTTLPATNVSNAGATLNGSVNPNGTATAAWFEWGSTANFYSQRTASSAIGSGVVASNVSQAITGLATGAVYYYRVMASNSSGVVPGRDVAFGRPYSLVLGGAATVTNTVFTPFIDPGVTAVQGAFGIKAALNHSFALWSDGTISGWGDNTYGQATVPAGVSNVLELAGGWFHTLALRSNGTIVAWGYNSNGQTNVPAGLTNVVAVAAGNYHSAALRADGTVASWGNVSTVPAGLTNVVAIAAGGNFNLALRGDGTVAAFGVSIPATVVPVGLASVAAVDAGSEHSAALLSNGTVVVWGTNFYGQTSMPAGVTNIVAIACGGQHTLALRSNGTVVAWGHNFYGQSTVPPGLTNVIAVAAGDVHSVALKSDGTIVLWGLNGSPQLDIPQSAYAMLPLAIGTNGTVNTNVPGTYVLTYAATNSLGAIRTATRTVYVAATAPDVTTLPVTGASNSVATLNGEVLPNGAPTTVWFEWGLGTTPYSTRTTNFSAGITGRTNVSQVLTGLTPGLVYHGRVAASNSAGVVRGRDVSFGSPALALNGSATVTNAVNLPYVDAGAVVAGPLPVAIDGGSSHSVLLRGDGTLVAWGSSQYGATNVPAGLSNAIAVAAGGTYNLVLLSNGTVSAFGLNSFGAATIPAGLNDVVAIAAGGNCSLALRGDGRVTAWGQNNFGQTNVPAGLSNVIAISAGYEHSVALLADGSVSVWGSNTGGQTNVPAAATNVTAISAGADHDLALRSDGTLIAWGTNSYGQTNIPAGLAGVAAIAAGAYHNVALRSNGTVVVWGNNDYFQTNIPDGLTNVVAIGAGSLNSYAIRSDGVIFAWGAGTNNTGVAPHFGQSIVPTNAYQSLAIATNGTVNTLVAGTYVLTYSVTNALGGINVLTRTVVVPAAPPVSTTLAASGVTDVAAILNGTLNPGGLTNRAWFQYGLTTNYGGVSAASVLSPTNSSIPIAIGIAGLSPLMTYHFRLVTTNSAGTNAGADLTFTTFDDPLVSAPSATVLSTNPVTGLRTVRIGAVINANGLATAVRFEHGLTTAYGVTSSIPALTPSFFASNALTTIDVSPGFTWHWRVVAVNGIGTSVSPGQSFTLGAAAAGLAGDVNGDGIVSQAELDAVYANYFTNSPWLQMTNVAGLGSTNVTFALSNSVSGSYTVQYSTNLVDWIQLGPATPRYLFTDTNAAALPQRYYRLVYP